MSATSPMGDEWYDLQEFDAMLDAIFGPGWRHPYCKWPRRGGATFAPPVRQTQPPEKVSAHLDLARQIRQMRIGDEE